VKMIGYDVEERRRGYRGISTQKSKNGMRGVRWSRLKVNFERDNKKSRVGENEACKRPGVGPRTDVNCKLDSGGRT